MRILTLLTLLICSAAAWAGLETVTINQQTGLGTRYVSAVAQDNSGVIWVGTHAGLYRYDGYNFTPLPVPTEGVAGNTVMAIHHDVRTDRLWVGTRSGLALLDCPTGAFVPFTMPEGSLVYNIADIFPAEDGGCWILNRYDCFIHIDGGGNAHRYLTGDYPGLPHELLSGVADGKGRIIVSHDHEGVSFIDTEHGESRTLRHDPADSSGLPAGTVRRLMFDRDRNLWGASSAGLLLIQPGTGRCRVFAHDVSDPSSPASNNLFSLALDSGGRMWAGADMGRFITWQPSAATDAKPVFENHVSGQGSNGLLTGNILNIFEDRHHNVWLADNGAGLDFISPDTPRAGQLPYFPSVPGIDNKSVWALAYAPDGSIWAGGLNSVAHIRGGELERVYLFPEHLRGEMHRAQALALHGGEILVGLDTGGMLRLDPVSGRFTAVAGENDRAVSALMPDGDCVLAATDRGVKVYRDGCLADWPRLNRIMAYIGVNSLMRDSAGNLLVGTNGSGLYVMDRKLTHGRRLPARTLGNGLVKALAPAQGGGVWVATKQSVARVTPGADGTYGSARIMRLNPPGNGLRVMRGMAADSEGNLWVSTDEGLLVVRGNSGSLYAYPAHSLGEWGNFNDFSAAAHGAEVAFGGLEGACTLTPSLLDNGRRASQLSVVSVTGADGKVLPAGEVKLSHDKSRVRIAFTVSDFSQIPSTEYSVMLEGLDKGWSAPQKWNSVTYHSLPPGKYTLHVRSRLHNRPWSEGSTASLAMTVAPPLWDTWWARTLYLLGAAAMVWGGLVRYRKRVNARAQLEAERKNIHREKELNQERLRFYTNITHELRTPLTLIMGPLEDLEGDRELPETSRRRVQTIHASAKRLLGLINQLLEFRRAETQNRPLTVTRRNLPGYVTEIGLRFKELNTNPQLTVVVETDPGVGEMYFDPDIVATVLNNLLSNAIKYTPSGTVGVSLTLRTDDQGRWACMSVADTGYGIEPEALPFIFDRYYQVRGKHQASGSGIGLALVKKLTEVHGGRIEVDSTPGVGSVFRFLIPADAVYPEALHKVAPAAAEPSGTALGTSQADEAEKRPTVLVVEDNEEIRQYIADSLADNYDTLQAADGKAGLELALEHNPTAILADLMMPVMDGLEMLTRLKGDIRTSHIPVVMLTARDSIADKERGYENGADSYLTKPFSARLLRTRLGALLESRRRLAERYAGTVPAQAAPRVQENAEEVPEIRLSRYDQQFLEKFTALIEENISDPGLDMTFLRDRLHMSNSTLYRKIKGLTGLGGKEYIRKMRLRHALTLIHDGYEVSEAAYASGFNDLGYFRSCFREEHGVTPTQYIKRHRTAPSEPAADPAAEPSGDRE